MDISRHLETQLIAHFGKYKQVLVVLGSRQVGKTSLARMQFPEHTYCNLEEPDTPRLAGSDPRAFFQQYPAPVILDEVQRVPELFQ